MLRLINRAREAAQAATTRADEARAAALSPMITDATEARHEMETALFERDRLRVAIEKLNARLISVKSAEEAARRSAEHDLLASERDQLVKELAELRDPIVALAAIVSRIDKLDREVKTRPFNPPNRRGRAAGGAGPASRDVLC